MTVKDRLHDLVDALTDDQAEAVLPILRARVAPEHDVWAAGRTALRELHEITKDLPPCDALESAVEARRELDQRPPI